MVIFTCNNPDVLNRLIEAGWIPCNKPCNNSVSYTHFH